MARLGLALLFLVTATMLVVIWSSRTKKQIKKSTLIKDGHITKLTIATVPKSETYARHYTSQAKIHAILHYLEKLPLSDHFDEPPHTYEGVTYLIKISYSDGIQKTYQHFANRFIREEHGLWKRIPYEEGCKLRILIKEQPSDEVETLLKLVK